MELAVVMLGRIRWWLMLMVGLLHLDVAGLEKVLLWYYE